MQKELRSLTDSPEQLEAVSHFDLTEGLREKQGTRKPMNEQLEQQFEQTTSRADTARNAGVRDRISLKINLESNQKLKIHILIS